MHDKQFRIDLFAISAACLLSGLLFSISKVLADSNIKELTVFGHQLIKVERDPAVIVGPSEPKSLATHQPNKQEETIVDAMRSYLKSFNWQDETIDWAIEHGTIEEECVSYGWKRSWGTLKERPQLIDPRKFRVVK